MLLRWIDDDKDLLEMLFEDGDELAVARGEAMLTKSSKPRTPLEMDVPDMKTSGALSTERGCPSRAIARCQSLDSRARDPALFGDSDRQ